MLSILGPYAEEFQSITQSFPLGLIVSMPCSDVTEHYGQSEGMMLAEEQQLIVKLCTSFKSSALRKGGGTFAFSHILCAGEGEKEIC